VATGVFSFNRFLSRCCLLVCIFLVACGLIQMPPASLPSGSATCPPPVNPYAVQSRSSVIGLYRDYRSNFSNLNVDKQKAFSQLVEAIQHSSDQRDFAYDNKQMVRITITYLDPVLVQYILLNDALVNKNGEEAGVFETELGNTFNKLANRQELLFVVILTTSHYDPQAYGGNLLTVSLPVAELRLFNTGNINVSPTHFDHSLDEKIIISRGPISGVVGYPISVITQNNCAELMDQWTTSLTLDVSAVTVNTMKFDSQFWRIGYTPLMQDNAQPVVNNALPTPITDINQLSPTEQPPTPFWNPSSNDITDWNVYWETMSRYLWEVFLTEINR
jgi:hypothetical protein